MAAVTGKVVRVEDVSSEPDDDKPPSLFGEMTEDDKHADHKRSALTGLSSELVPITTDTMTPDSFSDDLDSMESEARDQVMPLPEGWPQLEGLQEKHSWDYSNTMAPSVDKAQSHLELLQTIMEDFYERRSRASTKKLPHKSTEPVVRKTMQFDRAESSTSASTELSIHGHGGKMDQDQKHATVKEPEEELPYLGAEDVINEVVLLLAKMETKRKATLEALDRERERSHMLKSKIDEYSSKRMIDLPAAVQKEHEACAMDISELNWHVSYRSRIEERNKSKVQVAETLNARLKEDIEFVNGHVPLVKEKLELEVDAMDRIRLAQIETDEELDTTMQRFRKVDAKSTEAHAKAEQERSSIKRDLDTVKDDLQKITKELEDARMLHESYIHQCNENRQKLQDNKQEIKVLLVREENMKTAEALQLAKVQVLEGHIKQKEFEQKTLLDANNSVQAKIDKNTAKYAKKEKHLRDSIAEKDETLRQLNRQNDELKMDNEDLNRKMVGCDKQKIADEKNLERMLKELEKTEQQTFMAKEDLAKVSIINNAIREQLNNDEEKCLQAEEALRTTVENLKKQVKEEIHTRTMLTARIHSDSSELTQTQAESTLKKELIDKKLAEVETAVQSVIKKVEKLRTFHSEKTKIIDDMDTELKNVADTKSDVGVQCSKQMADLSPPHKQIRESLQAEKKKLESMLWKTDMMNKNIKEMSESAAMMSKAVNKTNHAISLLQADLEELNIQIERGTHIKASLAEELDQLTSRVEELDKIHTDHMEARNQVLTDHQTRLEDNKRLNTQLASEYRQLQNQHVELKNKMLNHYEERVHLESAVKDLKQLKCLQERMHSALLEYFKLRGQYSKNELQQMGEESHNNAVKVGDLQNQMDGALEKITFFLKHQLDGDSIRRMAMDKVDQDDKAAGIGVSSTEQGSKGVHPKKASREVPVSKKQSLGEVSLSRQVSLTQPFPRAPTVPPISKSMNTPEVTVS